MANWGLFLELEEVLACADANWKRWAAAAEEHALQPPTHLLPSPARARPCCPQEPWSALVSQDKLGLVWSDSDPLKGKPALNLLIRWLVVLFFFQVIIFINSGLLLFIFVRKLTVICQGLTMLSRRFPVKSQMCFSRCFFNVGNVPLSISNRKVQYWFIWSQLIAYSYWKKTPKPNQAANPNLMSVELHMDTEHIRFEGE